MLKHKVAHFKVVSHLNILYSATMFDVNINVCCQCHYSQLHTYNIARPVTFMNNIINRRIIYYRIGSTLLANSFQHCLPAQYSTHYSTYANCNLFVEARVFALSSSYYICFTLAASGRISVGADHINLYRQATKHYHQQLKLSRHQCQILCILFIISNDDKMRWEDDSVENNEVGTCCC